MPHNYTLVWFSEKKMGRKQHQGDKLWLTTQEWKYFFGGKKPNRKTDPEEVSVLFDMPLLLRVL